MLRRYHLFKTPNQQLFINRWDVVILLLLFAFFIVLAGAFSDMAKPFALGEQLHITLDPHALPAYALRTVLRMGIAFAFSLLFTFLVGTWAAKSRYAEKLIIPLVDVLQSVPVLAFQAIAIVPFIHLFHGSLLGPEVAAIFAIFTAQAWNMMLGFYQTLRTLPEEFDEVSRMYHLSAWQKFWRIEVPFSMPSLLWNAMMSMSAGWFFVVATEAITVANQSITLPGIGSYIALAIKSANLTAVGYAIIAMLVVIIAYDQLLFRPLLKWSERFVISDAPPDVTARSWFLNILLRARFLQAMAKYLLRLIRQAFTWVLPHRGQKIRWFAYMQKALSNSSLALWRFIMVLVLFMPAIIFIHFVWQSVTLAEVSHVVLLGLATSTRVLLLIIISSIIWVPIGVKIGLHPKMASIAQPLAQFFAAFPANLLFPLAVLLIAHFNLNVNIWTSPLMVLGSQWYILFNVIAGSSTLPKDLHWAADNLGLSGWLRWRRLILPGIFPYFITGAITAAGGAWNASIVAEFVSWGNQTLIATGLGAYITEYTAQGDFHRIALGIGIMCIYVLLFNRLLWQPLYRLAEERFKA